MYIRFGEIILGGYLYSSFRIADYERCWENRPKIEEKDLGVGEVQWQISQHEIKIYIWRQPTDMFLKNEEMAC